MKKTLFLVVSGIILSLAGYAQDTLQYMSPQYMFNTRQYFTQLGPYEWWGMGWNDICCYRESFNGNMTRYSTDDSVWVYGICMTYDTVNARIEDHKLDLILGIMAEDSSMVFIDSVSWKPSDHRAFFKYSIIGGDGVYYEKTVPAFELYFDTPHLMTDTFFVGLRETGYNAGVCYFSYDSASSYIVHGATLYPTTYYYTLHPTVDVWGGLFPIIVPNRHCDAPTKPRTIVYTTTNTVQFELPYTVGDSLLLSVARAGQPADSGDLYNVTGEVMSIVLPDSGHYEARLRRFCSRNDSTVLVSDWGAAASVTIPNQLGITGCEAEARLTISPNPAKESVTVECDIKDGTITLLDIRGRTLAAMPSSQSSIDLSGLPAGTYILRLTAPQGSAVKKLTVTR